MKRLLTFISIIALVSSYAFSQKQIKYGSNNGKYLSIFNTQIYYEEYGKGTPLILLQGGMGSIEDFALCIPELSKHFRVIAPDSPGQGRSAMADSMSYQLMAAYFSKMIDLLKLDSAYIMGWSDGGNTALLLANSRPDKIKKVVTSGANYTLKGFMPASENADSIRPEPIAQWAVRNKNWIDNYMKVLPRDWKKLYRDVQKMWFQKIYFPASVLEGIKIPVMIVIGDKDFTTLEHGSEMHHLIKGSQFCVLPNTTHAVFKEKPDLINKIAIEFFERK